MRELGINVPEELCFYPFRVTFDFECYFDTSHLPPNSPKVHWLARHEILSVSICSNVPGFSLPCCFINEGDQSQLVDRFITYLHNISDAAYSIYKNVYKDVFVSLEEALETVKASELANGKSCHVINNDNDNNHKDDDDNVDI